MAQNPMQMAAGLMGRSPFAKKMMPQGAMQSQGMPFQPPPAMPFGYNPQGTSMPTWPDKPPVVNQTPPIIDYPPKPPIINETPPIIDYPVKQPPIAQTPPIIDLPGGILNQKKKRRPVTVYNE